MEVLDAEAAAPGNKSEEEDGDELEYLLTGPPLPAAAAAVVVAVAPLLPLLLLRRWWVFARAFPGRGIFPNMADDLWVRGALPLEEAEADPGLDRRGRLAPLLAVLRGVTTAAAVGSSIPGVCCHHADVGLLSSTEVAEPGDSGTDATEPAREREEDEALLSVESLVWCTRLWAAGGGAEEKLLRLPSSSLSKASCAERAGERGGVGTSLA